ncbi:MAG: calcium/sodium antiporter [Bacteroidales bacterium]|nr:calcium/sodium antiporter [Bacteroidales bacterium]
MFQQILILLAGLALIIIGAEFLVKGASGIARKAGISEFIIGLTIVAIGTSAPEMVVSLVGAFEGNSDVAAGNVLGSNIFNELVILGAVAIILPITVTKANRSYDLPWYLAITIVVALASKAFTLFGIGSEDIITRWMGALMLAIFAYYIYNSYKKSAKADASTEDSPTTTDNGKYLVYILLSLGGLGMLVFGGQLFVDSATEVAHIAGLSDKFIAITVLAFGTSFPELATSIVAAFQKKGQLALGNILGSNIFNMLLIMGTSALVTPVHMGNITLVDYGVLILGGIILCKVLFGGKFGSRIGRLEGFLLVGIYAAYMVYLFNNL